MNLILSRHGNTFGPKDQVVWAGSQNDLSLVEQGVDQAKMLAELLKLNRIEVKSVFCGPLKRTLHYSKTIINTLGLPFGPKVDIRLNEVDYGEWTGLTQIEVIQKFGEEEVKNWDQHSVWPKSGNWGGSESSLRDEVQEFMSDLVKTYSGNDTLLIVTSNGRLRFFLTLIEGEFERRKKSGNFKVKTGNICKLVYKNGLFTVVYWNQQPTASFGI